MEIALSSWLKLGFVKGEHPQPDDPVMKSRWKRYNNVIMTWLLCSVSKNVASQILHATDIAAAWKCLHMRYAGTNVSRKFGLQQEIANLVQGDMTVPAYFEKLVNLWQDLEAMRLYSPCTIADDCLKCRETAKEIEESKVMKFLMGLNESMAHIRSKLLALMELPSIDVPFDKVCQHEIEKNATRPIVVEASTMYANQQQNQVYASQQQNHIYANQAQQNPMYLNQLSPMYGNQVQENFRHQTFSPRQLKLTMDKS
ncbi:hypothetical protein QQ045_000008 [Rhodiola kirilowii]